MNREEQLWILQSDESGKSSPIMECWRRYQSETGKIFLTKRLWDTFETSFSHPSQSLSVLDPLYSHATRYGWAEQVEVEKRKDGVCVVTINRPNARNAVDAPTAALLADAFRDFDRDPNSKMNQKN